MHEATQRREVVWEVKPDHVVRQATEAQIERRPWHRLPNGRIGRWHHVDDSDPATPARPQPLEQSPVAPSKRWQGCRA
jgi:hypothetical protein